MVPINFIRIGLFNLFLILFLINITISKPQEKYNTNIILNNKLINNVIGQEPYPYPDDRTDFTPEEIRKRIEEAEERKEEIEIQCQQKRIYAIALGVLSIFFLVLISIYTIFKCYLFCSSRTPLVRISKIGEVMGILSIIELFGGVGLFLFGMSLMGSSLEKLAGSGMGRPTTAI